MIYKPGVDIRFLDPIFWPRLDQIEAIFLFHAPKLRQGTITSANDGEHHGSAARPSLHYAWQAIDLRHWWWDSKLKDTVYIDDGTAEFICADLRKALGSDFDVVLHPVSKKADVPPHIHIEFDPEDDSPYRAGEVIGMHGPFLK